MCGGGGGTTFGINVLVFVAYGLFFGNKMGRKKEREGRTHGQPGYGMVWWQGWIIKSVAPLREVLFFLFFGRGTVWYGMVDSCGG